jgi:hypothetical protein
VPDIYIATSCVFSICYKALPLNRAACGLTLASD